MTAPSSSCAHLLSVTARALCPKGALYPKMSPGTAAVLVPPVFASADPARTAADEMRRAANLLDLLRW